MILGSEGDKESLLRTMVLGLDVNTPSSNDSIFLSIQYQILDLKLACEEHLSTLLKVEKVSTWLVVADMHSAETLKENCLKFIVAHPMEVMITDTWKHLCQTRVDLMTVALRQLAKRASSKGAIVQQQRKPDRADSAGAAAPPPLDNDQLVDEMQIPQPANIVELDNEQ